MSRRYSWTVLVLCASCASPPDSLPARQVPIVNGTFDDGDDAVCALVSANEAFCTGTLVAPRVVLTAAHCLRRGITVADAFFGKDVAEEGRRFPVVKAKAHPAYNDETLANDIGVLLLDGLPHVEPLPMNTRAFDDTFVGQTTRLVGFGVTQALGEDEGRKRQTNSTVTLFRASDFTYSGTAGQTCQGDSGGPALLTVDGKEVLAGVTSWGDEDCTEFGIDTRVDVFVDDFVRPFIEQHKDGPSCAADGACLSTCAPLDPDCPLSLPLGELCQEDEECASALCVPAFDDSTISFCSRACHRDADCPWAMGGVKMVCQGAAQGAVCRFPLPTPGAQGWRCTADSECQGGLCSLFEGDWICTRPCGADDACASGTTCRPRGEDLARLVCFPEAFAGGFCQVAPASPGGTGPCAPFVIALLGWIVRRVLDGLAKKGSS